MPYDACLHEFPTLISQYKALTGGALEASHGYGHETRKAPAWIEALIGCPQGASEREPGAMVFRPRRVTGSQREPG